jgi:hypothetical protein
MLDGHPILSQSIVEITVFILFAERVIAAIRAGRALMAELGLLKKSPTTRKFSRSQARIPCLAELGPLKKS